MGQDGGSLAFATHIACLTPELEQRPAMEPSPAKAVWKAVHAVLRPLTISRPPMSPLKLQWNPHSPCNPWSPLAVLSKIPSDFEKLWC